MDGTGLAVSDEVSKVAVVTGGSRGIGTSLRRGARCGRMAGRVGYRTSETDAKEALEAIERAGGKGIIVHIDTLDEASVVEAFKEVTAALGPVTGLVNNAGYSKDGLLITYPTEQFERTMDTNVRGAFLLHPGRPARHAPSAVGPDREHVLGGRVHGNAGPDGVRGVQVGPRRHHEVAGPRGRRARGSRSTPSARGSSTPT